MQAVQSPRALRVVGIAALGALDGDRQVGTDINVSRALDIESPFTERGWRGRRTRTGDVSTYAVVICFRSSAMPSI